MTTSEPHSNTACPDGTPVYRELRVSGQVQGVGFRPFVLRVLSDWGWPARIANVRGCVVIQVALPNQASEALLRSALQQQAPIAARISSIDSVEWRPGTAVSDTAVRIVPAEVALASSRLASAAPLQSLSWQDRAICTRCLEELFDPGHRLFQYPFISCCDCGPRYSVMTGMPFDRERTAYHDFPLCDACWNDYRDPEQRRCHAQTLACASCGPALWMAGHNQPGEASPVQPWQRPAHVPGVASLLQRVSALLRVGGVLAIKGLSGFHLCCDATQPLAIERLRDLKQRPAKPLAVMATREQIEMLADCSQPEWSWLLSSQAPIVLVKQRPDSPLPARVTDGLRRVGVMLPYTGWHCLLLAHYGRPMIMTSANVSGERLLIDNQSVWQAFAQQVDGMVFHDRQIVHGLDDSVVQVVGGQTQVLRSARGFAVSSLTHGEAATKAELDSATDSPAVLALGAEHKNAFCLAHRGHLLPAPYAGSLASLSVLRAQQQQLANWLGWFELSPDIIVADAHPDTATPRLLPRASPTITHTVQHHHAHFAAVLLEHHRTRADKVFALAFDGHGWGEDGTVWGGELLFGDAREYQRLGHLRTFSLLGGDQAARQPWRNAVSVLLEGQLWNRAVALGIPLAGQIEPSERAWFARLVTREQSRTSALGRLFDAVYALITGDRQPQAYEGQAAMRLQNMAESASEYLHATMPVRAGEQDLDWYPILATLLQGMAQGTPPQQLALQFHRWLAESCAGWLDFHYHRQTEQSGQAPARTVVLCGGVFQNALLLQGLRQLLATAGWTVLSGNRIPVNDQGIALGQAAIVMARNVL